MGRTAGRQAGREGRGATRTKCACGGGDGAMMVAAVVVAMRTDKDDE